MRIAACLIVRNEAHDLAEWIAYHALSGIDAFLVYDNASTDGTADTLTAAAALHDVRITPWRTAAPAAQLEAYRHALRVHRREFDWIAVIDSDEFIVVHQPGSLRKLCTATTAAAIGINWAMFGSNGHASRPRGLVTESFTRRAEASFAPNRHVKMLVRPGAVTGCLNPHAFAVQGPVASPAGQPLTWHIDDGGCPVPGLSATPPEWSVAQLNHYFTRSRAHWVLKTARGYRNPDSMDKLGHFDHYDRNEAEDRSALWVLAETRAGRNAILAQRTSATLAQTHARLVNNNAAVTRNTQCSPSVAAMAPPDSGPNDCPRNIADAVMP